MKTVSLFLMTIIFVSGLYLLNPDYKELPLLAVLVLSAFEIALTVCKKDPVKKSLLMANANLIEKNKELYKNDSLALCDNLIKLCNAMETIQKQNEEIAHLKKQLLSTNGNLTQLQKKYAEKKKLSTMLISQNAHLKKTIAESDKMMSCFMEQNSVLLDNHSGVI
jgi:septal ring factor EnvC (AmiA/AmiB activator)